MSDLEQGPSFKDRDKAILWARSVVDHPDEYVVLDTETTGLRGNDEIIQIAIVDLEGGILLDSFVKPYYLEKVDKGKTRRPHGISVGDLEEAPSIIDILPEIKNAFHRKTILIYNADFDLRLLEQSLIAHGGTMFSVKAHCVMLEYARFFGEWLEYKQDYKFQKLPGSKHRAKEDCSATIQLIGEMSRSRLSGHLEKKKPSIFESLLRFVLISFFILVVCPILLIILIAILSSP